MYQTADAKTKRQLTLRYATLYERLHDSEPKRFSLSQPATVMGQLSEADPYDVDLALAHAELLLGDGRYDEARRQLTRVLKELNPNNTRAIKDLFNVALAERNFGEALEYYHRRVAFNPRDPFLHYWMAQWYAGQERYYHAYRELDQLESAGRRGAVAVLLYHGLSASPNGEVQPVARLRETLTAFQQAGFHFIAAHKLSAYFIKHAQLAETLGEGSLERVICVTFDDARRDTMRYATPVGQQLKLPFSMLVPVGFILKQHPFMCTWDMLRDYQRAGCWSFGGHTLYAHERVPIDAAQRMGFALPNHIWRPQEKRLETDAEYAARLTSEYDECHDLIVHNLDHAKECNYFAYPFGDIGQCTRSNDPDAPRKNLEHAAHYFAVGLIQTDRGYAMADDNPLLFQRYEPDRSDSAATVLEHVLVNHPVQVARRLRAQYAALEDKRYLLLRTLRAMQLDGYPEPALRELIADCERAMHRRIPLDEIEHVEPAVSTMVRPETNQPSVKPSEKPVAAVTPPSDETPAPRRPSGQRSTGDAFESAHPGLRDLHDPLK